VNSYLKPLLAVAAVVVIAVAGVAFLGQPSDSGVGGAASPAPSPTPVASPSPSTAPSSAVFPPWFTTSDSSSAAGILPSGNDPGLRAPLQVHGAGGLGQRRDEAGFYGLFPDTPANQAEFAASGGLAHETFMGPHESPYFVCDAWEDNRGATAAEMVASMLANEALATSEPIDVTIGGLTEASRSTSGSIPAGRTAALATRRHLTSGTGGLGRSFSTALIAASS